MYHDHYDTLAVDPDASQEAISAAYRRAVWTCHPDRYPADKSARRRFYAIQEAFETLNDPEKRAIYDTDDPDEPAAYQPRPRATRQPRDPLGVVRATRQQRIRDFGEYGIEPTQSALLAGVAMVVIAVGLFVGAIALMNADRAYNEDPYQGATQGTYGQAE